MFNATNEIRMHEYHTSFLCDISVLPGIRMKKNKNVHNDSDMASSPICRFHLIYLFEQQSDGAVGAGAISHMLLHSADAYRTRGWTGPKAGAGNTV